MKLFIFLVTLFASSISICPYKDTVELIANDKTYDKKGSGIY
jgi:hypothetical protein